MRTHLPLDVEELRRLLTYNPESGEIRWRVRPPRSKVKAGDLAGTVRPSGYLQIRINGRSLMGQRVAYCMLHGVDPGSLEVDHADRDTLNNRGDNLRVADESDQKCNRGIPRNNTSTFKGVSFDKVREVYRATIMKDKKRLFLGRFKTAEEAGAAYDRAASGLHGDFAVPTSEQTT